MHWRLPPCPLSCDRCDPYDPCCAARLSRHRRFWLQTDLLLFGYVFAARKTHFERNVSMRISKWHFQLTGRRVTSDLLLLLGHDSLQVCSLINTCEYYLLPVYLHVRTCAVLHTFCAACTRALRSTPLGHFTVLRTQLWHRCVFSSLVEAVSKN